MPDIYLNNLDGIPYGVNAGRPANPQPGQPYFNGEANRLEIYTQSTGWQNIVQETPAVVSITGQANQSTSSTITINGTNFGVGANVFAVGTDGVEVQATTATVVSVVEITATLPPLSPTYEPYDVKVVNPSNLYGVLYETLGVNNSPIWSTSAGTLGTFTELQAVSVTVAATDATDSTNSPLSYSVVSGALPGGLTLNSSTGVISGTATSIVSDTTYSFTIAVTDGRNTAVTRAFSITISDRGPVWSTTSPLPSFTRNASYSTTLSANDDDGGAISYSLLSGSLPTGLTLSSGGVISGTPTGSSPSTFTIRATSSGNTVTDRQFTIPNVGPTWVTSSIDSAVQNLAYSFQLSATDDSGVAPTYSIVTGSLPAGFSMNSSGLITGSSASQSSTSITFRATDANSTTSDRTLTFTVAPPPIGGTLYQTPGSYTFTVPANVYSLSVVAIGGGQGGGGSANSSTSVSSGGGAGGGLSYGNNISVTPGQTYSVVVGSGGAGGAGNQNGGSAGGPSSFASLVVAGGGSGTTVGGQPNPSTGSSGTGGTSGGTARSGGGTGGAGGGGSQGDGAGGGGGAGGYAGNGGLGGGAGTDGLPTTAATAGSGGAGGGGSGGPGGNDQAGYGGGGVGVYGQGSNGAAGNGGAIAGVSASIGTAGQGGGGSGGGNGGGSGGDSPGNGGSFGGGGGGGNGNSDVQSGGSGAGGAVRIIWGLNRTFPSTNVGQNYNGVTETVI